MFRTKPMAMAGPSPPKSRIRVGRFSLMGISQHPGPFCERPSNRAEATVQILPERKASTHPHDACFLTRVAHFSRRYRHPTKMAWLGNGEGHEVIFGQHRSQCLPGAAATFNFEPVWHQLHHENTSPRLLSSQRNGDAVRQIDCVPRSGKRTNPGGWRANKKDGGCVDSM